MHKKGGNSDDEPTIYLDESVSVAVSEGLKRRGFNIFSAKDVGNRGLSDREQLEYAIKKEAVIVTNDVDFLSIARKSGIRHFGIIYYQQEKYSVGEAIRKIEELATLLSKRDFENTIEFL